MTLTDLITKILIPIGSGLIAGIALLVNPNVKLPSWVFIIFIFYLLIVIIAILAKPFTQFLSKLKRRQQILKIAKFYYPTLHAFSIGFARLIDDNVSDSMSYFLHHINQYPELRNVQEYIDSGHIDAFKGWNITISELIKLHNPDDFTILVSGLSNLISRYNLFCAQAHRRLLQLITSSDTSFKPNRLHDLRQEWTLKREIHNQFINDWIRFMNLLEAQDPYIVSISYYETLRTLE